MENYDKSFRNYINVMRVHAPYRIVLIVGAIKWHFNNLFRDIFLLFISYSFKKKKIPMLQIVISFSATCLFVIFLLIIKYHYVFFHSVCKKEMYIHSIIRKFKSQCKYNIYLLTKFFHNVER